MKCPICNFRVTIIDKGSKYSWGEILCSKCGFLFIEEIKEIEEGNINDRLDRFNYIS